MLNKVLLFVMFAFAKGDKFSPEQEARFYHRQRKWWWDKKAQKEADLQQMLKVPISQRKADWSEKASELRLEIKDINIILLLNYDHEKEKM